MVCTCICLLFVPPHHISYTPLVQSSFTVSFPPSISPILSPLFLLFLSLSINRTLKMYIGGAQKRPDTPYARPVVNPSGKIVGQVSEGNRKDIREAEEAAHRAAPGYGTDWLCCSGLSNCNFPCSCTHTYHQSSHSWGKQAAHNRAQIVYYIAENLELRHDEVAQRIANMTGTRTTLDFCFSAVCPTGHV